MKIFSGIVALLLATSSFAQVHETRWCGQQAAQEKLFNNRSGAQAEAHQAAQELEEYTDLYESDRSGDNEIYYIPVVFHVIHQNGPENISDEQIQNAVSIMTRDFRKQNPDIVGVHPDFATIAADCHIEFRLATKDPQGNCHTGINRIVSALTNDGYDDEMKELSYWPRSKYLNIWVCADIDGAAGFSNYPSSVSSSWEAFLDGIVVRSNYVGNIGTGSESRSRTLTHEAGHWLNLMHLWGDSNDPGDPNNCGMSDEVADTPQTIGHTSCSLNDATCGSLRDNVQNYMEYSYCSNMFTNGQRARMRAALTSSVAQRNQLITQSNLIATGVVNPPLCAAAFTSSQTTTCVGEAVSFEDDSYNGVTTWTWSFGDGETLSGSNPNVHQHPVHAYAGPGTYDVSLTVGNGTNTLTKTIQNYITVFPSSMIGENFSEGFEATWPNQNFAIDNQNADLTFEVTPTAFFSGSKSLKLRNHGNTTGNNTDILYTATFDLSNAANAQLSYKWAYANKTAASSDQLIVSYSGDCGNTWDIRRTRDAGSNLATAAPTNVQFTPANTDQWNGESLSIGFPSWLTDNFQARFEFIGRGGNNFYLDDINLTADFGVGVEEVKPVFVFGVYPNPSSENMSLEIAVQSTEDVSITLYNATGQLCNSIYSGRLVAGKHILNIEKQAAGLYNIVVQKGSQRSVQKVIFE